MSRRRNTSLFVRNLSDRVRYEDIEKLFGKYGRIYNIKIPLDYYSGRMKGFGFVEYEDYKDAEYAKERLDGTVLLGKEIGVEVTSGIRKTPAEMRDRERGARRGGRSRSRSVSRGARRRRSYSQRRSGSRDSRRNGGGYSRSPS